MYLLDTNICIYLIKKRFRSLQARIEIENPYNIAISAVSIAELEFGIAKSLYPGRNREVLLEFLSPFEIIPFSEIDCEVFGIIRAYLKKSGTPIGPYDLQIAAQCLSRNYCLITKNLKEFEKVKGLEIQDWTQESDDS